MRILLFAISIWLGSGTVFAQFVQNEDFYGLATCTLQTCGAYGNKAALNAGGRFFQVVPMYTKAQINKIEDEQNTRINAELERIYTELNNSITVTLADALDNLTADPANRDRIKEILREVVREEMAKKEGN